MEEQNFFKNNLKYIRLSKDLNQQELADILGYKNFSSISDWERGKSTPNVGTLQKIADMHNITITELMEKDVTVPDYERENIRIVGRLVKIPMLGTISCGDPITASENINEYVERSADDLPGGELFYLRAKGESMSPLIPHNSKVLCRVQPDVENGEIAAVLVNGDEEATLKRVRKMKNSVLLEPINDDFEPILLDEETGGRIIGRAIEMTTEF